MTKADPVLLFLKSDSCVHCTNLSRVWGDEIKGPNTVKELVRKDYSSIRFQTVVFRKGSPLNEKEYPSGLSKFAAWFPMILLIPGPVWNKALAHLGPNNPISLVDGTQIMNGIWRDGAIQYVQGFDSSKAEGIQAWVKQALAHPDFRRLQYNLEPPPSSPSLIVPSRDATPAVCSMHIVSRLK